MLIALSWRGIDHLAECDDTCGTPVDAESATGTHVIVDCVVIIRRVQTGHVSVNSFVNSFDGDVVNALPRADVHTPFALNAFRLVDIDELFRFTAAAK